ncbi:MAG: restriction endonuclease subunit S [Planctomycetia bacterium]|nr:restriction endonuclease subunit S [Planctomycetia bacterium]
MAKTKKSTTSLPLADRLQSALVPEEKQPYEIPKNWAWVKLGGVCNFERGITFPATAKSKEMKDGLIPCLRTANVQEELDISDFIYVDRSYMKENPNKLTRVEDIIMSSANSRELVGKVSYVKNLPCEMTFGGFLLTIRANRNILSKYLFFMLRNEFLAGHFMQESTQTTNIANINTTILGSYPFPFPPLAEQERIVARLESLLGKLDEVKERVQNSLESFKLRKASVLHKAFHGELTEKWREKKDIPFSTWKNSTIGQVIQVHSGKNLTSKQMITEGKIPVYGGNGITGYHNESNVPVGTVVIGRVGFYCGSVHYISEPAWVTDNALVVSFSEMDFQIRYLYFALSHANLRQNNSSTAQPVISASKISSIPITIPTLAEQEEIVRLLDQFFEHENQAKTQLKTVLEKIESLKKSILMKAFRGKLGTHNPTDENVIETLKNMI